MSIFSRDMRAPKPVARGRAAKGHLKRSDAHDTGGHFVAARHVKKAAKVDKGRRSVFGE